MENKDKRALIVDDDPNICELLRLYFTKEGFKVRTILDGNDALQAFDDFEPTLVVLDLMLPGKDGYDICREIRKTSQVPIIMLTARGGGDQHRYCIAPAASAGSFRRRRL